MGRRLWLRHLTGIASGFAQKTTTPVTKNPTHPATATGRRGRIPLASTQTMRRNMQCLSCQQRSRRRRHHWPRHCGNDTSSKLATAAGFVLDRGLAKKVNVRYRLEMDVRETYALPVSDRPSLSLSSATRSSPSNVWPPISKNLFMLRLPSSVRIRRWNR